MALSLGLGIGHTRGQGGGFDLRAYLSSLSQGFLFDYSDPDWLRQEPNGPTAVAAANDVVGLGISRRLAAQRGTLAAYLAGQPELRSQAAPFLLGSAPAATYNPNTGVATVTRVSIDNQSSLRTSGLVAGRTYLVSFANSGSNGIFWRNSDNTVFRTVAAGESVSLYFVPTLDYFDIGAQLNSTTATLSGFTIKEVSQVSGTQANGTSRPRWQGATGVQFDGVDDNHLTGYVAATGANFIVARGVMPLAQGTVILAGSINAGNNRSALAFDATGVVAASVGGVGTGTIRGTTDLRGQDAVIGVTWNGSQVRLFANGRQEYEAAQTGTPNVVVPWRIGCLNGDGTPSQFFGGSLRGIAAGADYLDLARFSQIASQL